MKATKHEGDHNKQKKRVTISEATTKRSSKRSSLVDFRKSILVRLPSFHISVNKSTLQFLEKVEGFLEVKLKVEEAARQDMPHKYLHAERYAGLPPGEGGGGG